MWPQRLQRKVEREKLSPPQINIHSYSVVPAHGQRATYTGSVINAGR